MMKEYDIVSELVNFLCVSRNFPPDLIIKEWAPDGARQRFDVAVMSERINYPIALFEVKSKGTIRDFDICIRQLSNIKRFFDMEIPCYIVTPSAGDSDSKKGSSPIAIFNVTDFVYNRKILSENELTPLMDSFPSYQNLSASFRAADNTSAAGSTLRMRLFFNLLCWCIIPLAGVLLLLADYSGDYELKTNRLLVLGVLVLIVLMPFFKAIKVASLLEATLYDNDKSELENKNKK